MLGITLGGLPGTWHLFALGILQARAAVTVYYVNGASATNSASAATYTGAAAYDPTVLTPPGPPSPFNTPFFIQLKNEAGNPALSIPQESGFFGFSIEMSVVNQVLGTNSSILQVPFLNLMANLQQRTGHIIIRVGGNTQETAKLVDSLPDGKVIAKDIAGSSNPTQTPPLDFTADLLYMMANISSFVNVKWHVGVPFLLEDATPNLAIVEQAQAILGDDLIGVQCGNEPDLYARHLHRSSTYSPNDYIGELGNVISSMKSNPKISNPNLVVAPSIASADWVIEQVLDTNFVDTFNENLAFLAVENYPADNCQAQFHTAGAVVNPQDIFHTYLTHDAGKNIIGKFINATNYAKSKNKKFLMFETNTASCGGFPGISDSFGAALWAVDYALTMAANNFAGALFHVGGQNVYYNPFTPPPTNQTSFHQWTIGPIYYAALAVAETIGISNTSQILDLGANENNALTPAFAIYENGVPKRLAIVNFVTDPSGNSDLKVSLAIGGSGIGQPNQSPAQLKVKYLLASSAAQKGNFTWAGQTFGTVFQSDGRPSGAENITTIPCDTTNNVCTVTIPAPSFALVFLSDDALQESNGQGGPMTTFPTTVQTRTRNTVTVDPSVLSTSNGGFDKSRLGSTSPQTDKRNDGMRTALVNVGLVTVIALFVGGVGSWKGRILVIH